jgi:hypothetical protein
MNQVFRWLWRIVAAAIGAWVGGMVYTFLTA